MNKKTKVFQDRFDEKYIEYLSKLLSIENDEGLIATSVQIEKPKIFKEKEYHKCIRIDFCGLSATTLLDRGKNFTDGIAAEKFSQIFSNLDKINDLGIFVKIRFLFAYMYSDFSYSLIKAEKSRNRATIIEDKFELSFDLENDIDKDTFNSSITLANQKRSLEEIQHIAEDHNMFNSNSLNTIQVRFTPISLNLCSLVINDNAIVDSYLYSKERKTSDRLSLESPVVIVNKESKYHFESIVDNFRYHWNHPTTMYCKDATYYKNHEKNTLSKIREPYNINFENKAQRIIDLEKEHGRPLSEEFKIKQWKFLLKQLVLNSSHIFQDITSTESIFIACSWRKNNDGSSRPNKYAQLLQEYIKEDFNNCIDIKLVESEYGGAISEKIYANLKQSTLGIVLLTRDIEDVNGKYYARPNIYHELGYLMNKLDSARTKRVLVLKKENVEMASNVNNFEYLSFDPDRLDIKYGKIIRWLKQRCETIGAVQIDNAKKNQKDRLHDLLTSGVIESTLYNALVKELNDI